MIGAARLAAMALLAGTSLPLAAQSQADPVHLDDFSVKTQADDTLQVEQLSTGAARLGETPEPHDRVVTSEEPANPPTTSQAQLSPKGQRPQQAQLSKAGASPDESSAAVSSTAQSRPQGVVRIAGQDRCDPQLERAALARCQRILELRAHEFNAPAAPQLSAEQTLLAEQRYDEESEATRSAQARLRLASREDPDAELQSNQEVAALYLSRQDSAAQQQQQAAAEGQQPAEGDATLSQVITAIQAAAAGGQGAP